MTATGRFDPVRHAAGKRPLELRNAAVHCVVFGRPLIHRIPVAQSWTGGRMECLGNDPWVKDSGPRRRFVAYYRVSTRAQGKSGLGLDAQRATVERYLQSVSGELFAEFTEVESGTKAARPQFNEALRLCRVFSATLVIAKLDRLARNVALIAQLMECGVEFLAADFPQANRLTIHILAAIAEYEAKLISERVKAAIVASKARGVVWGGNRNAPTLHLDAARRLGNEGRKRRAVARAMDLEPLIMQMRESGKSLKGIAAELNRLGIHQRQGGINWMPNAVRCALRWSAPLFPNRKRWNKYAQRFE